MSKRSRRRQGHESKCEARRRSIAHRKSRRPRNWTRKIRIRYEKIVSFYPYKGLGQRFSFLNRVDRYE